MTGGDRLLTAAEVADLLAVSTRFVRDTTRDGRIPCIRFPGSRSIRYRRDSIERWVAELEQPGQPILARKHTPSRSP